MRGSTAERIEDMTNVNAEATSTETAVAVAEQGAPVGPTKAAPKKNASSKKEAPKAKKRAKSAKPATKKPAKPPIKAAKSAADKEPKAPGAESKGAKILELIGRPKGATLAEIMKAIGWQAHSVRGFLSTAGKKRALNIESTKNEAGERVYQIKR
jgi:hypothetical protein